MGQSYTFILHTHTHTHTKVQTHAHTKKKWNEEKQTSIINKSNEKLFKESEKEVFFKLFYLITHFNLH